MRRDKPPPQTLKSLLAEKFYTASASDESNETDSTGDIGYFQQPSRGRTSCRGRTQDHGSQKPIHNFQDQSQRPPAVSRNSQMKPCSSLFGAVGSGSNNRARPSNPRKSSQILACHPGTGGGDRDRTDDLLLAKQMLSQLSYAPENGGPG